MAKPILYNVEVENFKTYAGKVMIGPFKPFMAVIGPNGSGKSNFVDAISFALGEKASKLRVKDLSDLIHGAHIGKPVSESASVTLYFKYVDTSEDASSLTPSFSIFRRVVTRTSQEYFINNGSVKPVKYLAELNALGLNIKAENFLIYQGKVETVALMDPKQRTGLFEEISGSKAFKRQYNDLKAEMLGAVESSHLAFLKQRTFRGEYQEAKQERGEVRKYELLLEELREKRVELQLFKLFCNQNGLTKLEEELSLKQTEVEGMQSDKKESEKKLKHAVKSFGTASRELAKLETEVQDKETQIKKVKLPFIKAKEEAAHLSKKLETAQSSLKQALDVQKKHLDTLKFLKEELANVRAEEQSFMESVAEESISQGRSIELEESQAKDYNELKRQAAHLSGSLRQQIESLTREHKSNLDRKENETRKCSSIKDRIAKKSLEKEECMKRCEKLSERISSNEKELQEMLAKQKTFKSSSLSCQENIASIQAELSQITAELSDAHMEKHDVNARKKKQVVVGRLKELFPGVYDRLKYLCEPVNRRYSIALTRVMGKHMNAIVVDKERTARLCIQYLKEQMLDAELFLPLDYIEVKPLQEYLRQIGGHHTHLLFDVVTYNPPEVRKAILFATRSVLVCDTPDDAMQMAFYNSQKMLTAIALDGTFYQKSGLISGGSADLARKAKQWDEKQVAQMQAKKTDLSEKLKSLLKQSRCQSELNIVDCEVKGYTSRIKLMKEDLEKSLSRIRLIDEELDKLNEAFQGCQPLLNEIEQTIEGQSDKLKTLEKKVHKLEDRVFSEFCNKIGVPNIRAYEEAGLKVYEEREKKRMEFDNRKNCIKNQLEYEKTVDTESNIKRWNDEIQNRESALTDAKKLVEDNQNAVTTLTDELKILNDAVKEKRSEVDLKEKETDKAKKDVKAIGDTIHGMQKQMLAMETSIGNLHRARRAILIHCHVEGIVLPIVEGDIRSLVPGRSDESESGSSTSASVSADSQATTSHIVIDYDSLSSNIRKLKGASLKEHETSLKENIAKLSAKIMSMGSMNLKVAEKLEETSDKLKETNSEIEDARKQARKAINAFEKIKKQRCDAFNECFDFVSNEIDVIYKQLTQSTSAMALLTAENVEEPYLGGIAYCCIAPGKPCKPMQSLSGGEKTIASIALVIALHRHGKAPCLILDEIDAALDNSNIANVARFFDTNKNQFHTIAISLQPAFYCHADALVGVTVNFREDRKGKKDPESVVFLYDLEVHDQKKN
ncbi:structural maintenance of chromosomes protein 1A-like [Thrips palmi]|uniref:Structural maintenance of chromosomes protein n=1 Tax=Thrips palmi TaxID=161013 RepID=A0A6P8ZSI4_THRPL|nr:structural maintenance of chromosomes protein 1A-like [Thrips palmi]